MRGSPLLYSFKIKCNGKRKLKFMPHTMQSKIPSQIDKYLPSSVSHESCMLLMKVLAYLGFFHTWRFFFSVHYFSFCCCRNLSVFLLLAGLSKDQVVHMKFKTFNIFSLSNNINFC